MPRKPRGPGRPVTTGSKSTPLVSYRVSADQHAELAREGRKTKRTANQVAKDRAFPLPAHALRKRAPANPIPDGFQIIDATTSVVWTWSAYASRWIARGENAALAIDE